MKLHKGDQIIVTIGKDKGKKGAIDEVLPKENTVLVKGLNIFKRHMKRRDERTPGGIIEFARPIPVGNVSVICPKCHKPTRIGYSVNGSEKHRICKKCQQLL